MAPWPYGTRPKAGAPGTVWAGEALLTELLGDWAGAFGAVVPVVGQTAIDVQQLCASEPPSYWPLTADELALRVTLPFGMFTLPARIVESAKYSLWPTVCEYIPAPDPVADPIPEWEPLEPPEVPPDVDLPPPLEPTLTDDEVADQLRALNAAAARMLHLLNWLTSNLPPRNCIPSGSWTISGTGERGWFYVVGYVITIDTLPNWVAGSPGTPPSYFDAGWVSFGRNGGLVRAERLTRPVQLLWTDGMEADQFQWELPPGVTATVQALVPPDVDPPFNPFGEG